MSGGRIAAANSLWKRGRVGQGRDVAETARGAISQNTTCWSEEKRRITWSAGSAQTEQAIHVCSWTVLERKQGKIAVKDCSQREGDDQSTQFRNLV